MMVEWATTGIPRLNGRHYPILIADSYYLDRTGREMLLTSRVPFVCCVNPVRFKSLTDMLRPHVQGRAGAWAAAKNAHTGELLVCVNDKELGIKFILTNAFEETNKTSTRESTDMG